MKFNKRKTLMFLCVFIFSLGMFYNFITMHYSTDTYNIINMGYKEYAIKYFLNDGRIFSSIILLIADAFNVPINICVVILIILGVFILSITVIILKNIIKKYKPFNNMYEEILITIISYITIFNFMFVENMYFMESAVMALSVLFFLLAAYCLVNRDKRYFVKSTILLILGVFSYQGTIGFFFASLLLLTIIKNKNDYKQIIKDCIVSRSCSVYSCNT